MISWPLLGNINFSPQIRVCGQAPMYNYIIYNTNQFRYLKIIFNSLKIDLIFTGKLRRELECAKKRKLETSQQHEAVKKSNTKNEPIVSKTVKAKENSGLILKSMEELTGQKGLSSKKPSHQLITLITEYCKNQSCKISTLHTIPI